MPPRGQVTVHRPFNFKKSIDLRHSAKNLSLPPQLKVNTCKRFYHEHAHERCSVFKDVVRKMFAEHRTKSKYVTIDHVAAGLSVTIVDFYGQFVGEPQPAKKIFP